MVDTIREADNERESADLEEDEENENNYIEDDTTTKEETADFEKHLKEQAKKSLSRYNEGLDSLTEENFLDLVNKLNDQQRKIFNDFVEKINSGMDEAPSYI